MPHLGYCQGEASRQAGATTVASLGPIAPDPAPLDPAPTSAIPPGPVHETAFNPNNPGSLSPELQGDILLARGSYAAAIRAYDNVTPRTASIWNKTGMAYHHLFAPEKALQDYKMAVRLDPHYAVAYNNMGAVYHGLEEYARAEKAYKTAIKYAPQLAVAYCNLGTTYFAESKGKRGAEAYQKALTLDPNVFSPQMLNKIEEGSARQQRVVTAYNLARVYAAAGRNPEAMAALNHAVSAGFRDRKQLLQAKEFASLRDTPEFRQILLSKDLQ